MFEANDLIEDDIHVGQIVRFTSGSPRLTIKKFDKETKQLTVGWFFEGDYKEMTAHMDEFRWLDKDDK
jgi:hypothetical protein